MDPAMMRRITAVKKPKAHAGGAFGKHGVKEVEYQYKDKTTGTLLVGKTLMGYKNEKETS